MNFRMTARYVSLTLKTLAVFMTLPLCFSFLEGETMAVRGFVATLLIICICFGFLGLVCYDQKKTIYLKDGFLSVAVCWITISLFGALPYRISGEIPSFADALFESTSGFTTTGASILTEVESLSRGLLLWRSFTHWIGGMGVLVFLLAVIPSIAGGERSISVLKAEAPGPAPGKLVPKLRQSSKILYIIYLVLTIVQILLLLAGGMSLFDSVTTAMSVAGTGGFSVKNASMAAYDSLYFDVVTTIFMILFGVNFNIYYFTLIRNFRAVYRSEELRAYLGIFAGASLLIAANLAMNAFFAFPQALRHAAFQTASVMTTTGFATTDYSLWPTFSKIILFVLFFIGGSAGSTAGGIKVSRVVMLMRETRRLLFRMVHPRSVEAVKLDGKSVDKTVVHSVNSFFTTLMILFFLSLLLFSLDNFDFETTVTAAAASLNNVGPGFGAIGPAGNYSIFSPLSKLVLCLNMLLGRLEIYPILLLLSPRSWKKI